MSETHRYDKNPASCCNDEGENGMCCIDTYKIFDSCRAQDCIENTRLFFTDLAQNTVNQSISFRTKSVRVLWTQITTEEAPFQTGYYQVNIRYYFYVLIDCCMGLGNTQEVQGLALHDKTVILYGGEGNVSTFQSDIHSGFCSPHPCRPISLITNLPRAVVEVAEPIPLKLDVLEASCGCPAGASVLPDALPDQISSCYSGSFSPQSQGEKNLFLTVGIFSIIRIERPSQLVIPACDVCIPPNATQPKHCFNDPCSLFRSMDFPLREFYPRSAAEEVGGRCPQEALDPKDYR